MNQQITARINASSTQGRALMNCEDNNGQTIIYKSGDTPLFFELKNSDNSPFVLTNATDIWVLFPTLVSPPVILKLSTADITLTNAGAGLFSCVMSQANAMLLTSGVINVELRITIDGQITVTQILGQITVSDSLYPGT